MSLFHRRFFTHFARKNQPPGFSIIGTLACNGLRIDLIKKYLTLIPLPIVPLLQTKVVAQSCSVKKVFLETLQDSQENTYARVCFFIKLQASLQLY